MATRNAQPSAHDEDEDEVPFSGGRGFFGDPNEQGNEPPRPGRLLAAIEVAAEGRGDDEAGEPIHFECVDTKWADFAPRDLDRLLWFEPQGPAALSVLEFERPPGWMQPGGAEGSIAWYEVQYEPTTRSMADGLLYTNLFGDGAPVRVVEANRVDGQDRRLLSSAPFFNWPEPGLWPWAPWGNYPEPGPLPAHLADDLTWYAARALEGGLTNRNSSKGVAIYDVGQGNWQGVLHGRTGRPFAYVDVGGGVLYNRKTFPKDFRRPPSVPLVILSHWDWDHWSSAARYTSLQKATWIAPSLSAKPIQRKFAMDLVRNGQLHILPPEWRGSIEQGCLRIEGCSGSSENDRGLAVTVYSRRTTGKTCLLPGDAGYRYIPSVSGPAPEQFDALCMSHHGGRLHSVHYPAPERKAIAANSSGPGNTYRHPLFRTLVDHLDNGWPMPIQTGVSGSRPCHVYLPWGKRPQLFHGTCNVASGLGLTV